MEIIFRISVFSVEGRPRWLRVAGRVGFCFVDLVEMKEDFF